MVRLCRRSWTVQECLQLFFAKLLDERTSQRPNAVGLGAGVNHLGEDRGRNDRIAQQRQVDLENRAGIEGVIAEQANASTRDVLDLRRPADLLAASLKRRIRRTAIADPDSMFFGCGHKTGSQKDESKIRKAGKQEECILDFSCFPVF